MPNDILQNCHDILEKNYAGKLGISFGSGMAGIAKGRQPIWRTVSDGDLTTEFKSNVSGAAGLLMDPEIGVLCYFLPFHQETSVHNQIMRCLALRSQLSIERNYTGALTDTSDSRGAWRVIVHWLVEPKLRLQWIDQITDVRRETAFSEELSLDAIFLSGGDSKADLEDYGFPRLLLTTREVFKKDHIEEMTKWLSANKLVEQALTNFSAQFHIPEQRELANDIVRAMQEMLTSSQTPTHLDKAPEHSREIRSIRIHNFRNLRDSQFDFGVQPVSTSIIYGPNGTGKSSLCEALSIALFQASFRYKSFIDLERETDVTARDRTREYFDHYLTPVDDQRDVPQIALNEQALAPPILTTGKETEEAGLSMDGTILTQDTSLEFARMPAHELGVQVLRGYSDLADHIEEFTESRVNQANSERQSFLRALGLTVAIKKIDTAYERIARREIDQSLPPLPQVTMIWLELVAKSEGIASRNLPQLWHTWGDDAGRAELARELGKANNSSDKLIRVIRVWLQRFNELALASAEFVKNVQTKLGPIQNELKGAVERITVWGEWFDGNIGKAEMPASPEAESLAERLHHLQQQQSELMERSRNTADHLDHLTNVVAFVREHWSKHNSNTCPSCGADYAEQGGIVKIVESLRANIANDREQLRQQLGELKDQIEQEQKRLTNLGRTECPLSTDEQNTLASALQWLVPTSSGFAASIGAKPQRDSLLASIAALQQTPSVPATVDVDQESERLARLVYLQCREADRVFETPAHWKPVKDKLIETLSDIVNMHLPNTLARLWCELALNLTSAPWLLPERPRIDVTTRRGEQKSTVLVNDRLARYVLNQSELHTLGIAWFCTRYLTRGRFYNACIVMDDPAQELDQTSFRDLCRLWETIVRLHRIYERPLKLIIMLNQESRAIEAARATGGILSVLGWERDQKKAISPISVVGEGFYAPQPSVLFEKIDS